MINGIIFDLFGVIISDGFSVFLNKVKEQDETKAQNIYDIIEKANRGQISTEELRAANSKSLGLTVDEYVYNIRSKETINYKLLEYIKELRHDYKMGLLSNVGPGGISQRLSKQLLNEHFDVVVASSDIGFAKPEAKAYEITASKLGVGNSNCIMIDDKEEFCRGAEVVGMRSIRYMNMQQLATDLQNMLEA